METRALTDKRGQARTWYAAGLLGILLAALLGAWFVSGWHDVRMRQQEVREGPHRAAASRATELARELYAELETLIAREARRPYFHYQNLMHDPRASLGVSVSPSPLAQTPDDKLVLGYFQIDGTGRATTPTINEDFPELSDPESLADNRAFRDQVVRDLVRELTPPPPALLVAETKPAIVAQAPRPPRPRPASPSVQNATPVPTPPLAAQQPQVIEVDPDVYLQNNNSNAVYWHQRETNAPRIAPPSTRARVPDAGRSTPGPAVDTTAPASAPTPPPADTTEPAPAAAAPPAAAPTPPRAARPVKRPVAEPALPAPVMITISPLEWRTHTFGAAPTLLAVRAVHTPDGALAQGFVVDHSTLTSRLAAKAGEMVAELRPVPDADGLAIAPGWQLTVAPNPRTLAAATASAADIARTFVIRFSAIGALAVIVAAFVLVLVMRAEKLARERSQFAAAAAHELRTPLAGLQLYGDMLADGLGDPAKVRDYARRMSEEASRLGRVVSNVLGFSQLERGNLAVEPQVGPLGDALCELAERAEPALDRAGAALELDVSRDLEARFDRDAVARIVGNLLDNAEKYARGAEDRTIRLAAHARGDSVEIVVQDRGPGIADATRLFRAFSRGTATDGPAGLGLGLALSRSLAQAMGGALEYRASDTPGATFVLRLPRA